MESDKQLVEAAVQGDTEAFGALVRKYSNALFAVAFGVLGDFHLAKDVAQETFLKAYLQLSTLADGNKAGSWLYTIAYRLSLNLKRKRKAEVDIGDGGYEPSDSHDVEEAVMRRETARQVWNVLNTLDETNKIPLILFYISEWSMREIAGFLDISVRAVESRLQRTKKLLRAELAGFLEKEFASRKLSAAFEREVMQQIPGLNGIPCIYIRVRDEQVSQTWYETVLGIDFDRTPNAGNVNIAFRSEDKFTPAPYPLFAFTTPDLRKACGALEQLGIRWAEDAVSAKRITFHDPDGNILCFMQA